MRWTYTCPRCGAHLNPSGSEVVLLAEHEDARGLMLFHPEPGNYEISVPRDMEVAPGQVWSFACPVCRGDLVAEEDPEMARLVVEGDQGERRGLLFSRRSGVHATFVFDGEGEPAEAHGEDRSLYESLAWMKWW